MCDGYRPLVVYGLSLMCLFARQSSDLLLCLGPFIHVVQLFDKIGNKYPCAVCYMKFGSIS